MGKVTAAAVMAVAVTIGVMAPALSGPADAVAAASGSTAVTSSACASGWSLPPSGLVSLQVEDKAPVTVDVELIDRVGDIVASLKELGPGTTLPLVASLARGSYRLLCTYDNAHGVSIAKPYATRWSDPVTVKVGVAASSATPSFLPTTAAEMAGPVAGYDKYVAGQIKVLQSEVMTLERDIGARNVAQTEADWVQAELTFSGIGGTYGAVGSLENAINGLASGFAGGASNPQFQGLHKIEYLLWSGQPLTTIEPFVNNLIVAINGLSLKWSQGVMTPNQLSTRAHEILEDALRDTLSGGDAEGSGESIAIVWSDLQGEYVVLNLLRDVIDQHSPKLLAQIDAQLATVGQALQATKVGGQWVPLASLTTLEMERIDAGVDQALETLSAIPDLLEVQQFTDGQGG
jgi:high-affinity iron transporter